jgi:hypothetical protein
MTGYELLGKEDTIRINKNCYVRRGIMYYIDDLEMDEIRVHTICDYIEEVTRRKKGRGK